MASHVHPLLQPSPRRGIPFAAGARRNEMRVASACSQPLHCPVVLWKDVLLAFGGVPEGASSPTSITCYCPVVSNDAGWVQVATSGRPPRPRHHHACLVFGGKLVVHGGEGSEVFRDMHALDLDSREWHAVATANSPRPLHSHSMTVDGGRFLMCGGMRSATGLAAEVAGELWEFDCSAQEWHHLSTHHFAARYNHSSTVVGGKLVVYGGFDSEGVPSHTVVVFDLSTLEWSLLFTAPPGYTAPWPFFWMPTTECLWWAVPDAAYKVPLQERPSSPSGKVQWSILQTDMECSDAPQNIPLDALPVVDGERAVTWLVGVPGGSLWFFDCGAVKWGRKVLLPNVVVLPAISPRKPSLPKKTSSRPASRHGCDGGETGDRAGEQAAAQQHTGPCSNTETAGEGTSQPPRGGGQRKGKAVSTRECKKMKCLVLSKMLDRVCSRAMSGMTAPNSEALLQALQEAKSSGKAVVLDEVLLAPEDYFLLGAVLPGMPMLTSITIRRGGEVSRISSQQVLETVRKCPQICVWEFEDTPFEAPRDKEALAKLLASNRQARDEKMKGKRLRRQEREKMRKLNKERKMREWEWGLRKERFAVEYGFLHTELETEEEALRLLVWLYCEAEMGYLWMHHHEVRVHIERCRAAADQMHQERLHLAEVERQRRLCKYKEEERAFFEIRQAERQSRRTITELLNERARVQRVQRDALSAAERDGRNAIKSEEEGEVGGIAKDIAAWWEKYKAEMRLQKMLAEEAESRRLAELRKQELEAERQRQALLAYERQQIEEQVNVHNSERTQRAKIRDEEKARFASIQAEKKQGYAQALKWQKEGDARRDVARCNFTAPKVVITTPPLIADASTRVQVCPVFAFGSCTVEVPLPKLLVNGGTTGSGETAKEWTERKSQILRGSLAVHMEPLPGLKIKADFQPIPSQSTLTRDGNEILSEGRTVATVCKTVHSGDDDNADSDSDGYTDEKTGKEVGVLLRFGALPIDLLRALVQIITVTATPDEGASLPSEALLVIKTRIYFPSPSGGTTEAPTSLVGGEVLGAQRHAFPVELVPPRVGLPLSAAKHVFVEEMPPLPVLKQLWVGWEREELPSGTRVTLALQPATSADVLDMSAEPTGETKTGYVVTQHSIKPIKGSYELRVVKRGRLAAADGDLPSAGDSETVLEFSKAVKPCNLQDLLRSVFFYNGSDDPVEGYRSLHVLVTLPNKEMSLVTTRVKVVSEDDPAKITFGHAVTAWRQCHRDIPEHLVHHLEPQQPLFFACDGSIVDVDTITFTGGGMEVVIESGLCPGDVISVSGGELVSVDWENEGRGKVYIGDADGPLATISPAEGGRGIYFSFAGAAEASIPKVDLVFKHLTFTTASGGHPLIEGRREIRVTLVVGKAPPVVQRCSIQVSRPLLTIPPSLITSTVREDAEEQRLAPFDPLDECDGWDGGSIYIEFLEGYTEGDDLLCMMEKGDITLGHPAKSDPCRDVKTPDSNKPDDYGEDFEEEAGTRDPSPDCNVGKRAPGVVRDLVRRVIKAKAKENLVKRKEAVNGLRRNVNRKLNEAHGLPTVWSRSVMWCGKPIGTLTAKTGMLLLSFVSSRQLRKAMAVDRESASLSRNDLCTVRRKEVASVVKALAYRNLSKDPKHIRKLLRVTAHDGLQQCSQCLVEIVIQPVEDATEIKRNFYDVKSYMQGSKADLLGFLVFDDCWLADPDSYSFNGGTLTVDLTTGGSGKSDVLRILSEEEQTRIFDCIKESAEYLEATPEQRVTREWGDIDTTMVERLRGTARFEKALDPRKRPLIAVHNGEVLYTCQETGHDRYPIGTLLPSTPQNGCHIKFHALPSSASRPKTREEAEETPEVVLLEMVEAAMHCLAYTNTAKRVKHNTTIFQIRVNAGDGGPDGRSKVAIDVSGPLLWSPEFALTARFFEGKDAVPVNPKIVMNCDRPLTDGYFRCGIVDGAHPDDRIELPLARTPYSIKANPGAQTHDLYHANTFLGTVRQTPHLLRIDFSWTSKITSENFTPLMRLVSFYNGSQDPGDHSRKVEMVATPHDWEPGSCITINIDVVTEDSATEIRLNAPDVHPYRLCTGPHMLAAAAEVYDPDTDFFAPPSYFECAFQSISAPSDVLSLSECVLRPQTEEDIPGLSHTARGTVVESDGEVLGVFSRSKDGFKVLLNCSKAALQRLVRKVSYTNNAMRERVLKRTVCYTMRSGKAAPSKVVQQIDLLPPYLDCSMMRAPPTLLKGFTEVKLLSVVKVAKASGCVIEVQSAGDLPYFAAVGGEAKEVPEWPPTVAIDMDTRQVRVTGTSIEVDGSAVAQLVNRDAQHLTFQFSADVSTAVATKVYQSLLVRVDGKVPPGRPFAALHVAIRCPSEKATQLLHVPITS
eukprot:Sspe_Gene.27641::Locus_12016_Transcript_1_1_Confidence_1.000_Length_7586::g.27641::m.27641